LIGTNPSVRIIAAIRRPLPVVFGKPSRSSSALVLMASMPPTKPSTVPRKGSAARPAASAFARCSFSIQDTTHPLSDRGWSARRFDYIALVKIVNEVANAGAGGSEHWIPARGPPVPGPVTYQGERLIAYKVLTRTIIAYRAVIACKRPTRRRRRKVKIERRARRLHFFGVGRFAELFEGVVLEGTEQPRIAQMQRGVFQLANTVQPRSSWLDARSP